MTDIYHKALGAYWFSVKDVVRNPSIAEADFNAFLQELENRNLMIVEKPDNLETALEAVEKLTLGVVKDE
jgi:hypothetical protein